MLSPSLVVFEDNQPVSLEVFSIGSTDITNDLALGFQISLEEADTLKKGNIQPSKARKYTKSRVDEIISARISDIAELVERHLVSVKKNHLLPAGVVITGGGSHLELLPQIMKHTLRLPIRVAADGIAHQGKQKTLDASWYVAYGLCVWIIQENSIRLRKASAFVDVMKQLGKKLKGSLRHLLP